MIDWLSSWLREIVLVVLFAVVMDMLLPNSGMKRYIKVVVSLFILLTVLSPILNLMRSDFDVAKVADELDRWNISAAPASSMPTPQEIAVDAERLQRVQEQQTKDWVQRRMAELIEQDLAEQGYAEVQAVQARIAVERDGKTRIEEIVVHVAARPEAERSAPAAEAAVEDAAAPRESDASVANPDGLIASVEPVTIEIGLDDIRSDIQTVPNSSSPVQEVSLEVKRSIRAWIVAAWGVSPDSVVFRDAAR